MEIPDKDLYLPKLQFARFGYQVMGFGGVGPTAFVDPYSGTRLRSQGTGARYNAFGGGYGTYDGSSGYGTEIYVKNPFNGTNVAKTGNMEFGKVDCGVASNGTTIISSGGWSEPSSTVPIAEGDRDHNWANDGSGPYVVPKIEYITSSSGGNAGDWGDVHHYTEGYPGDTGETADDEFYYGANAVGEDGATGFYACGNGRYSPGRAFTNEIWKISIASASDSVDWGSNNDYWKSYCTGISGYTGTQGTLDTRWLIMGGAKRDVTATSSGSTTTYLEEVRYYTFASASSGDVFGNPHNTLYNMGGYYKTTGSNGTRAVAMGGGNVVDKDSGGSPGAGGDTGGEWQSHQGNTIEYYTVASTGNATMFGDMTHTYMKGNGQACNGQYLESWGGYKYNDRPNDNAGGTNHTIVNQISIATTGNAVVNGAHIASGNSDIGNNGGTGSN